MASLNHHNITKILDKVVRSNSCFKTVKKIKIIDDDSNKVIEYDPDYVIKRIISNHTYYLVVFEVIEGQADIKTMADIARIIAKPEIKKAIFLCSNAKMAETERISSTLIGSYKERFEKRKKNEIIDISIREVLPSMTEDELEKLINEEVEEFLPREVKSGVKK